MEITEGDIRAARDAAQHCLDDILDIKQMCTYALGEYTNCLEGGPERMLAVQELSIELKSLFSKWRKYLDARPILIHWRHHFGDIEAAGIEQIEKRRDVLAIIAATKRTNSVNIQRRSYDSYHEAALDLGVHFLETLEQRELQIHAPEWVGQLLYRKESISQPGDCFWDQHKYFLNVGADIKDFTFDSARMKRGIETEYGNALKGLGVAQADRFAEFMPRTRPALKFIESRGDVPCCISDMVGQVPGITKKSRMIDLFRDRDELDRTLQKVGRGWISRR